MTHICVSKLTIIGSDNGLSPGRRQAIIWTNAGLLLIGPLGTNFNEILIGIHIIPFKKIHLKCRLENGGHLVSASMCWDRNTLNKLHQEHSYWCPGSSYHQVISSHDANLVECGYFCLPWKSISTTRNISVMRNAKIFSCLFVYFLFIF